MQDVPPLITVVIAAYSPGAGIDRVVASLDAQTLPQTRFETIIVDDGSPDDTYVRLQGLAAGRPNMQVHRIENSGWPSRPRNVATQLARGEWVLFMDHDDSLYPDALRRAAEYAAETRADLLSPKESKTTDVWWGLSSLRGGNQPDVAAAGGIELLLPMVPHKLYRRAFLQQHDIRFPEGRRMLWEDIYLNVMAYRHAERVAVLADTPVYLWHSSPTNNSKSYGPRTPEFWDRLDDLFAYIDRTLDTPAFADARRTMLLHQYRGRVLGRFTAMLPAVEPDELRMALARARAIQERWVPLEWEMSLGVAEAARAWLLRAERPDLLRQLYAADRTIVARTEATEVAWDGPRVRVAARGRWNHRDGGPLPFLRRGDRVVRDLPAPLVDALPPELIDVTDDSAAFALHLGVRSRDARVTWQLPTVPEPRFEPIGDDRVTIVADATTELDPRTGAGGRPLDAPVWDFYHETRWIGHTRAGGLRSRLGARAALLEGRGAVVYANVTGNLSLDLAQRLRNVVKDGAPAFQRLSGTAAAFSVPLPGLHVHGPGEQAVSLLLTRQHGEQPGPLRDPVAVLPGRIVADDDGARLEAGGPVKHGTYRVWPKVGEGLPLIGAFVAQVHASGSITIRQQDYPQRRATRRERAASTARVWERRARRVARRVRVRLLGH